MEEHVHTHISLSVLVIFTIVKTMSLRKPSLFSIVCTESIRKYVCRVYHQHSQYIAKLRQITIDLCKSRLVTIETPRNHSLSQHRIIFAIVKNTQELLRILISNYIERNFQITLKLHENHNHYHFAPTHISLRRLSPRPPDLNTVGKLRLSSFCIYINIGGSL